MDEANRPGRGPWGAQRQRSGSAARQRTS